MNSRASESDCALCKLYFSIQSCKFTSSTAVIINGELYSEIKLKNTSSFWFRCFFFHRLPQIPPQLGPIDSDFCESLNNNWQYITQFGLIVYVIELSFSLKICRKNIANETMSRIRQERVSLEYWLWFNGMAKCCHSSME